MVTAIQKFLGLAPKQKVDYNNADVKMTKQVQMPSRYITTTEAASIAGVTTTGRIRQLLLAGILKGKHFGRDWMVERKSVEEYAKSYRKRGPKPLDK